jgi:hypothetical protein
VIVRFIQRHASFFAIFAGLAAYRRILPDDAKWWIELAVVFAVGTPIYLLLYKDGVTANRPKR